MVAETGGARLSSRWGARLVCSESCAVGRRRSCARRVIRFRSRSARGVSNLPRRYPWRLGSLLVV